MRETTIERKNIPIELITAAESPRNEKILCTEKIAVVVFLVLKTLLITDRMEFHSQRV